jgi:hypothetical protein
MVDDPKGVKFSPDYVVYTPRNQGVYPIPETEWNRLKKRIGAIVPARRLFQNGGAMLMSVSASAVLSLLGFQTATALAPWVIPSTWAILISSFLLGGAFFLLDRFQQDTIQSSVMEVLDEIRQIEENYVKGALSDSSPAHESPGFGGRMAQVRKAAADPSGAVLGLPSGVVPSDAARHISDVVRIGARVRHRKFGLGTIVELAGAGRDLKARIDFDDPNTGRKTLVIAQANLEAAS